MYIHVHVKIKSVMDKQKNKTFLSTDFHFLNSNNDMDGQKKRIPILLQLYIINDNNFFQEVFKSFSRLHIGVYKN